ncbi:exopolysaccharide biosynthesis protein [Arenibaculum pallidiluteum]|uniref:exopolysaccharide biosynthesis protein n=1 Tax=Arenibaculum pallidiluteum TaxID=2812559 RepID=UPI001A976A95|nr:exopolysaccharide biosynthesis protein [Arenibaculum pallidiluteum]
MTMQETVDPESSGGRVTAILENFRDDLPPARVTLGALVERLGDRAFGAFLLIVSLPNILPVPVGVATVLEIPLLLIAVQMAMGRRRLWLPAFALRVGLSRDKADRLLQRCIGMLQRTERWVRPRLLPLTGALAERLIGALCVVLGIILVVPVPLLGWFPAFALVALALGLVERDGVMMIAGLALSVLTAVATAVFLAGISAAGQALASPAGLSLPFIGP